MSAAASPHPTGSTVAVLGAGSWGTALALLLAGHCEGDGGGPCAVRLWDRTPALLNDLRRDGENRRYLPGFALPPAIVPEADLARALDARTTSCSPCRPGPWPR
jgi:glycerol-3-phosphate dehydrogenase (NAD(P)+)